MTAATDTIDAGTDEAIDFGAGSWSKGAHLEPPAAVTDIAARNLWRMVEGMTRWSMTVLDPTAPDRDPMKMQPTSEELVTTGARALVIFTDRGGYVVDDAEQALELAQRAVDEAVRRLERDAANGEPNGHDLEAAHELTKTYGEPVARFTLIDDAVIENLPVVVWLLHRVIGRGTLFTIFGQPGSLKTFLALLLAFSIALGRTFHGRAVEQGPVIFVAAEGATGLSLRVRALREAFGLTPGERAGVYFITEAVNLSDPDEVAAFVALVQPLNPAAIIFDTLARNTAGVEENSATEMGNVIGAADYIRQRTGAAVGFIHHPTKSGLTERGSSALRGAVDALLQVVREDDVVVVTAEKLKDAEPFEPMHFRTQRVVFEDGESSLLLEPTTGSAPVRTDIPTTLRDAPKHVRAIIETLAEGFIDEGASASVLLRTTKVPDRSFYRAMSQARTWGFIIKSGQRYQLTLAGKDLLE